MKDLTKLTPEEANKIECLLLTLEKDVKEHIEANERLSKDYPSLTEELRKTFASNCEWFKECYLLIYEKEYSKE